MQDHGQELSFRNIRIKTTNLAEARKPVTKAIPQVSYLTNQLTQREKEAGWRLATERSYSSV